MSNVSMPFEFNSYETKQIKILYDTSISELLNETYDYFPQPYIKFNSITNLDGTNVFYNSEPIFASWDSKNMDLLGHLRLLYSVNEGVTWTEINDNINSGNNSFQFTPTPDKFPANNTYRLKIMSIGTYELENIYDVSDIFVIDSRYISILPFPLDKMEYTSDTDSECIIKWKFNAVSDYVKIELVLSGNTPGTQEYETIFEVIEENYYTDGIGLYTWNVKNLSPTETGKLTAKIKITDCKYSNIYSYSGNISIIIPSVSQISIASIASNTPASAASGDKLSENININMTKDY